MLNICYHQPSHELVGRPDDESPELMWTLKNALQIPVYMWATWRHYAIQTFDQQWMNDFFFLAQQPNAGHGRLIRDVSRSYTVTRHSRQDSSGREIGSSQRPLPKTHNTHKRQTYMPPAGFEPAIPASDRPLGPANDVLCFLYILI